MSTESMTDRDAIDIKRLTSTDDAEGVPIRTYTKIARGDLPHTNVKCRIQPLPPQEAVEFGLTGNVRRWKIYSSTNPSLDERDHVFLSDEDEVIVEARVVVPSFSFDRQGRLWKCVVELSNTSI